MTSSLPDRSLSDRLDDVPYVDAPRFFSGIAWPQLAVLLAIGAAVLVPIGLAMILAL